MNTKLIEDFGEKIGGARKDLKGNFAISDLGGLTAVERLKLVRKDMVWPTPDYLVMVKEGGYSRDAAAMIKMLRDSFPSSPIVREGTDEERYNRACQLYINTLNTAKRICTNGKTILELQASMLNEPDTPVYLARIQKTTSGWSLNYGERSGEWRSGPLNPMALSWRQFSEMTNAAQNFGVGCLDHSTRRMLNKNPTWPEGTSLAEAWLKRAGLNVQTIRPAISSALENNQNAAGYRVMLGTLPLEEGTWSYLGQPATLRPLIGKVFETEALACEALKAAAETRYAEQRSKAKAKHQALIARAKGATIEVGDSGYREGVVWRASPAVTENYLNDFRLRGGEFGHWVNQSERQLVLDRGYDALRDLGKIFEWPAESLSIGGTLAIAFGSRGRGGKAAAAAHYEPGRKVINLTKPHGEGCLAHEWAHALDHYLGERASALGLTRSTGAAAPFLSEAILNHDIPAQRCSEEVGFITTIHGLMKSLVQRPSVKAEELALCKESYEQALKQFDKMWSLLRKTFEQDVNTRDLAPAEVSGKLRAIEEIRGRVLQTRVDTQIERIVDTAYISQPYYTSKSSEEILNSSLIRLAGIQRAYNNIKDNWSERLIQSNYNKACQLLDKEAKKTYYALPHEMFARAFEASVADSLSAAQLRNPYLVSAAKGDAYPQGAEREKFTHAISEPLGKLHQYLPAIRVAETVRRERALDLNLERAEAIQGKTLSTIKCKI